MTRPFLEEDRFNPFGEEPIIEHRGWPRGWIGDPRLQPADHRTDQQRATQQRSLPGLGTRHWDRAVYQTQRVMVTRVFGQPARGALTPLLNPWDAAPIRSSPEGRQAQDAGSRFAVDLRSHLRNLADLVITALAPGCSWRNSAADRNRESRPSAGLKFRTVRGSSPGPTTEANSDATHSGPRSIPWLRRRQIQHGDARLVFLNDRSFRGSSG